MAADDQYLGNTIECITDGTKEFMFGAHATAVLTREFLMLLDFVGLNMFGVELQDDSGLMIDKGDGAGEAHGESLRPLECLVCAPPHRRACSAINSCSGSRRYFGGRFDDARGTLLHEDMTCRLSHMSVHPRARRVSQRA